MVLFLFFCIGTTAQGRANTTVAEGVVQEVVSPIERILYGSSQYIRNVYNFIVELPSLKQRNEELEKKLKDDHIKLANYDKIVQENEELLKLLDLTKGHKDYEFIPASVVSIDPYRRFSVFVIDKGSRAGVKKNMTVVLSEGLVGRVLEVTTGTSKVLSIIDNTSMFNGISVQSRDYLRITGDDDNKLKGYTDFDSKISVGDIIVTSGLVGVFPKDIVIGVVKKVDTQEGKLEKIVEIEPSVQMEKINKVLIIK